MEIKTKTETETGKRWQSGRVLA